MSRKASLLFERPRSPPPPVPSFLTPRSVDLFFPPPPTTFFPCGPAAHRCFSRRRGPPFSSGWATPEPRDDFLPGYVFTVRNSVQSYLLLRIQPAEYALALLGDELWRGDRDISGDRVPRVCAGVSPP